MMKFNLSALAIFVLSGCSSDTAITPPTKPVYKSMPDINQSMTPSQQRSIMSGGRPDWSEITPLKTMKRY